MQFYSKWGYYYMDRNCGNKQAYFVGGGLASLAGAVYLIRDCGMEGKNIHIMESMNILGGCNDGIGTPEKGYVCRGGRMLNRETFENFWDLFRDIPSLVELGKSVTEEILDFDAKHPTCTNARLIDKNGKVLSVQSMGFNNEDRITMLKLLITDEAKLDNVKINDWFSDHFFTTNFWYMWQTTFAFFEWSSMFEFRRYMNRMIFEYSRIQTLEGVTRTRYNQYDSLILPLKSYLNSYHVDFVTKCTVMDIDFDDTDNITVKAIHCNTNGTDEIIQLKDDDMCFVTNGSITDCSSLGGFNMPAPSVTELPPSYLLWSKMARKKPGLGNPEPFFKNPNETTWESFTVTFKGNCMDKLLKNFSRNTVGIMTFPDSSWRMSFVGAVQPHFPNQPEGCYVYWGYGLYPNKIGDYVKKPMRECTGKEILTELVYQYHFEEHLDEIIAEAVNVIPCIMPYIDSHFQPRAMADRPAVIPKGSTNLAMISQFVEIPKDMVFTEEYSVRAARMAVYRLMDVHLPISPVTPHSENVNTLFKAVLTSLR